MSDDEPLRTHVEFTSTEFPPDPQEAEKINPGRHGKRLAEFVAAGLPAQGFKVKVVDFEDWGVRIEIENPEFPLWIGCGNYEEFENGFLCFIEPHTSTVRRWFKVSETRPQVEALASALDAILRSSGKVTNLRWWDDSEVQ
jgi:hypothetical protein